MITIKEKNHQTILNAFWTWTNFELDCQMFSPQWNQNVKPVLEAIFVSKFAFRKENSGIYELYFYRVSNKFLIALLERMHEFTRKNARIKL